MTGIPNLPPVLTQAETGSLLADYQTGDAATRDTAARKLVEHNMRIVVKEAGKVWAHAATVEDLHAAGQYGLLMAARRCDPDRPHGWHRLATMEVRNALRHELRRSGRGIVLSDRAARHAAKVNRARRTGPTDDRSVIDRAVEGGVPREAAEALVAWTSPGGVVSIDLQWDVHGGAETGRDMDVADTLKTLTGRLRAAATNPADPAHKEARARLAHPTRLWRTI